MEEETKISKGLVVIPADMHCLYKFMVVNIAPKKPKDSFTLNFSLKCPTLKPSLKYFHCI